MRHANQLGRPQPCARIRRDAGSLAANRHPLEDTVIVRKRCAERNIGER
jgi:hypothetical protein